MNLGLKSPMLTEETAKGLNIYLSNLHVLFTKMHNYHWNVVGYNFFDFHAKLQTMYEYMAEELDLIAERILMLGYKPVANLEDALKYATIEEVPSINYPAPVIAQSVICDFYTIIDQIRKLCAVAGENADENTVAILSESLGFYEKNVWMFNAFLTHM